MVKKKIIIKKRGRTDTCPKRNMNQNSMIYWRNIMKNSLRYEEKLNQKPDIVKEKSYEILDKNLDGCKFIDGLNNYPS